MQVLGLLGRRLGLVKLRFCVSFSTCFFGWVAHLFWVPARPGLSFCFLLPALSGRFPFIFLLCCLAAMAGTRTVVVDLRDFPPNFEQEDIAKRFYDQYGEDYPIDAIQIFPGGVC